MTDMLNIRQIAFLLGRDAKDKNAVPELSASESGLWTYDEVRKLMEELPLGKNRILDRVKLSDQELLTSEQVGRLHYPRQILGETFSSYVRRTLRRIELGGQVMVPPPAPVRRPFGHPLWHPLEIAVYLKERPGGGYHVSGPERRGYRGGRVPKAKLMADVSSGS